ncbi:pyruvate dehydrogenase complex dihydrolipoamide acetyltransferase [Niastella yeongjuensis]|uniref:Acetyltransferase component of pyruvate dehydrogenase complex n=1 Tax=Niastella yeongjuensis TaxID=354355 RepID=A0A1V9EM44_9BACT|nr:pyruvate dehydrogenase complex dihydrolipoamide acetyltransferase [Niastella yeongjuensis]OQP47218.1 pyruvate dehydrogenase complex dihydrolipoamide acetyltransferase [Niastella yeongjuensis]SEN74508.1 pyruvate dehydrogenase E2 component (dihydrolipoamide acetyltransferase) [Niastella yeongjuensis]
MAEVILMPRLSDTMTEGVIAAWHKKVGDKVKKGDLLAEVETDKATMELESYKDGTLLHIGTEKGGKLQVNDLLAIIGNPGEDISSLIGGGGQKAAAAAAPAAEPAKAEQPAAQPAAASGGATLDLANMQEVILMPRLSDTMTEGVIAAWHKKVGDNVKKGDLLADVETDKATMELESYKEGKLLYIGAQKGDKVPVNALLCIIGDEKKVDVEKIVAAAKGGVATAGAAQSQPQAAAQPTQTASAATETAAPAATGSNGRVLASPLAKKLAEDKGIDISKVAGSGDGGRIIKRDIDNYTPAAGGGQAAQTTAQPGKTAAPAVAGQVSFEDVPVSQMRKVIAKRLAESKFTAPEFYLTMEINMDKAVESRARINEIAPVKISFNDMVLKACAIALKQHPKVNSSWMGDKIRVNHHVNIGVAVAVEEGLLVPVVRFADLKSLSQIGTEVKEFAKKAKDKKLQPADWEGSTFTISNLGMFGIEEFTAIINPPDSCILAVGAINQVPVVKNGQIVVGNVMKVTLTCDHRVVDGATGAAFLQTLQQLLEEPLRMLV